MSNLSQFMRGTVSVGEFIELSPKLVPRAISGTGDPTESPRSYPYYMTTISGATYLRTGTLINYTSDYQNLFTSQPKLTIATTSNATYVNVGNQEGNWGLYCNVYHSSNVAAVIHSANNRYYTFIYGLPYAAGGGNFDFKTCNRGTLPANLSSACAIEGVTIHATGDEIYDSVVFPPPSGNLYLAMFKASYGGSALYNMAGGNVLSAALVTVSATGSGNLIYVDCNSNYIVVSSNVVGCTAAQIKTSTDGTSWTSRTPTLGADKQIGRMSYSRCGEKFVYISQDGYIYTAADGYTMTNIGTVSGLPQNSAATVWIPWVYGHKLLSAHSANESIWIVGQGKILKTTNCTTFTCTEMSGITQQMDTALSNGITGTQSPHLLPKIYYHEPENRYYLVHLYSMSQIFTSDDGGTTWDSDSPTWATRDNIRITANNVSNVNFAAFHGFTNANGWMVTQACIGYTDANSHAQIFAYKNDYTDIDNNPTYVGWQTLTTGGSGTNGTTELWFRIK